MSVRVAKRAAAGGRAAPRGGSEAGAAGMPRFLARSAGLPEAAALPGGAAALGQRHDPEEREADAFADMLLSPAVTPSLFSGAATSASAPPVLRCSPVAAAPAPSTSGGEQVGGLPAAVRAGFEARSGMDFGGIRLHSGGEADAQARALGTRAFTVGHDIWLGSAAAGDTRVLAHELGHAVLEGDAGILRRYDDEQAGVCTTDPAPAMSSPADAAPVCAAADTASAPPAVAPLETRVAAFKQLVRTTAVHRLTGNQRNLALWALAVESNIPDTDLDVANLSGTGALTGYMALQDVADPDLRELRAQQAMGHYRACTGCHIENSLWGTRDARRSAAIDPSQWLSPDARRAGAGAGPGAAPTYTPPPGTAEATLANRLPSPEALPAIMARVRPILDQLGPGGYRVLPAAPADVSSRNLGALRDQIIAAIHERHADYGSLIAMIESGEVSWDHFGPIITDLLPTASEDVRAAIQAEMDSNARWGLFEAVVVGLATVGALLLTIFPPTSIAGVAALGALDVGLAGYGLATAPGMITTGTAFDLGTGANDVFSPSQQDSGAGMVLGGFMGAVLAPLGMASGLGRLESAATRLEELGAASSGLARTGASAASVAGRTGTFQLGPYLVTMAEDGSITATLPSRPELLIIVRDGTATLYQSMGPGGMRVLQTMPVSGIADVADMSAAGTPMLGAGPAGPAALPAGPADLPLLPPGPPSPLALPPGPPSPLALPPGPPAPLALPPGPPAPLALPPGPAAPLALPAGPRPPLMLGPGNPTTLTWDRISRLRQPLLWQERETYMQQVYGASGQQHFPVPGTGGRFVDVPVPMGSGQLLAGEVKSYTRWITVEGSAVRNEVDLTDRIQTQINRDVWLRNNVPGYDPRWIFTDAPPSAALREALRNAGIVSITHL